MLRFYRGWEICYQRNVAFTSFYKSLYIQELDNLNDSLATVSRKCPIPKEVTDVLWEHCIRLSNRTFVEGVSEIEFVVGHYEVKILRLTFYTC